MLLVAGARMELLMRMAMACMSRKLCRDFSTEAGLTGSNEGGGVDDGK